MNRLLYVEVLLDWSASIFLRVYFLTYITTNHIRKQNKANGRLFKMIETLYRVGENIRTDQWILIQNGGFP